MLLIRSKTNSTDATGNVIKYVKIFRNQSKRINNTDMKEHPQMLYVATTSPHCHCTYLDIIYEEKRRLIGFVVGGLSD
jgi:pyridoxal biosynthesis lyase PdxS